MSATTQPLFKFEAGIKSVVMPTEATDRALLAEAVECFTITTARNIFASFMSFASPLSLWSAFQYLQQFILAYAGLEDRIASAAQAVIDAYPDKSKAIDACALFLREVETAVFARRGREIEASAAFTRHERIGRKSNEGAMARHLLSRTQQLGAQISNLLRELNDSTVSMTDDDVAHMHAALTNAVRCMDDATHKAIDFAVTAGVPRDEINHRIG